MPSIITYETLMPKGSDLETFWNTFTEVLHKQAKIRITKIAFNGEKLQMFIHYLYKHMLIMHML